MIFNIIDFIIVKILNINELVYTFLIHKYDVFQCQNMTNLFSTHLLGILQRRKYTTQMI